MGKITNEMVEKSFEIGKRVYQKRITRIEGIKILTNIGMKESSANDYIYNYQNLIEGKQFTRTTNAYGTEYYLRKIYEENGLKGLEKALLSLSQHIGYYEDKSGSPIKKRKEIYKKYLSLIIDSNERIIYPDEVDDELKYLEGRATQVLINRYERNPIARKQCIEHFGINCQVCNFNFQKTFGDLGENFIHVHHKIDISTIGKEYSINPLTDLIPVCPNCHAMLHKRKPAFSIEELKARVAE